MPSSCSCKTFHFVDVHVGARAAGTPPMARRQNPAPCCRVGVSFQQSQKYECAQNRISASRINAFARALTVPVGWFFNGLPASRRTLPGV
jgi:hypothetical protein